MYIVVFLVAEDRYLPDEEVVVVGSFAVIGVSYQWVDVERHSICADHRASIVMFADIGGGELKKMVFKAGAWIQEFQGY